MNSLNIEKVVRIGSIISEKVEDYQDVGIVLSVFEKELGPYHAFGTKKEIALKIKWMGNLSIPHSTYISTLNLSYVLSLKDTFKIYY